MMGEQHTDTEPSIESVTENVDNNKPDINNKKIKPNKEKKVKPIKEKKIRRSLLSRFDLLNRFRHWFLGGVSLTRSMFRVKAACQGIFIITAILTVMFILSAYYTGAGEFVISLDSTMSRDGFYLSNNNDFRDKMVCLRSRAVVADNISIFDIGNDVDDIDGVHDGPNYVAHTFYLTNDTGKTKDYQYSINIRQSSKHAEKAMWVMVFKNGKQTIYAMNGSDGNPESQQSIYEFPYETTAETPEQYNNITGIEAGISASEVYQAQTINQANDLQAVPFESEKVICSGVRPGIKDKEVDKYTVVMWYEGEDPDCTDDIIGGWVEVYMGFDYLE